MNETPKPTGLDMQVHRPSVAMAPKWRMIPSSLGEAMEMANLLAQSELCPKAYRGHPADCIVAYEFGASLGLSWMQSLRSISVINGQAALWGDAIPALILGSGECERFKEVYEGEKGTDAYTAVCTMKRKGLPDETIVTFSVADAKKANLWGKQGPWQQYSDRMLKLRARGFCARDIFADKLSGLIIAEEAMDYPIVEGTVVASESVESSSMAAFNGLPEGLRDNIEKAFSTMNIAPGLRLAKINEFCGVPDVTPEDGAQNLLDWARDEFARRKTGQPRAKRADNGKKKEPAPAQEPKSAGKGQTAAAAAEAPQEPPAKAEAPSEAKKEEPKGSELF